MRRKLIVPLAMQFLAAMQPRTHRNPGNKALQLGDDVLPRLEAHSWPGNVRELKAVCERAVLLARGGVLSARHITMALAHALPPAATTTATPTAATGATATDPAAIVESAADSDEARERSRIVEALESCAGNQTRAAKQLGISRATLVNKLAVHRIPRPRK